MKYCFLRSDIAYWQLMTTHWLHVSPYSTPSSGSELEPLSQLV
jgi:hypothetical protein